ncbi:MAG: tetratricopeptide repeat protein [Phycisphaerae bacterium]|nr:tetratricopeptide repeat protein [Phycisphaerae bacterium]
MQDIQRGFKLMPALVTAIVLCAPLPARADDPRPADHEASNAKDSLAGARTHYMKGRYDEAATAYRKLLDGGAVRVRAAVGLADALGITGEYDKAIDALNVVAEPAADHAAWHVAMAEVLAQVGRYDDALTHARKATTLKPDWAPALVVHGQLLETLGRDDEAVDVYRRMEDIVTDDAYRKDARSLVALGEILNRFAILTGRKASAQAQNILSNYFEVAYLDVDPTYWPARVATAMFLIEKHKPQLAAKHFAEARTLNKRIPDVHAGLAALYLGGWKFEKCLAEADKALAINPHHDLALYVKAACNMQWRRFEDVPPIVETILKVNPNHVEALSLMAAAYVRMDRQADAEPYMARVRKVNAQAYELPHTIGQWLVSGRDFDRAEGYLLKAAELAPERAEPWASLGKMYMETGEETKALEVLEKARRLDDFRADVANYLNVARKLRHFDVEETDHFIIKVDHRHDKVLLDLISKYMEDVYEQVCSDFGHEPVQKTIIEVLPNQEDFSARISGRGWIPTVGASTGRVIAIAAPSRQRAALGLHNWAEVLRHEFVHTVTLGMTNNRIPHWFTEACAVWSQKDKRAAQYIRALVAATQNGQLMKVEDLNWGFIRPRRPGQRMLAYAQSEWMLDYIIRTRGFATINHMLRGFADGQSQADVFRDVLDVSESEFNANFRDWAKAQIVDWGFSPDAIPDLAKAKQRAETDSHLADAHADYALALMAKGKLAEAERAAREALKIDRNHSRALRVLASVHLKQNRHDTAIETAQRLENADPTTAVAPRVLARCYLHRRDWPQAIGALELLQKRQPLDDFSYEQLANIYMQLGQSDKALPNLLHLHQHSMNNPQHARQIAEIYRARGQDDLALRFFRDVTYINPYETSAYQGMAGIYTRQKRYGKAKAAATNMTLIEPDNAQGWNYLAMVGYRAGKATANVAELEAARNAAEKAHALDPGSQATQIIAAIDAAIARLRDGG